MSLADGAPPYAAGRDYHLFNSGVGRAMVTLSTPALLRGRVTLTAAEGAQHTGPQLRRVT